MSTENALGFVRATEQAALAASAWAGRGDNHAADRAAVESMRTVLNGLAISGEVVIGEGERDKAPMLFIGERLGTGGARLDIALDPLEGTNLCARGEGNALSVLAVAPRHCLLNAPDVYMEKIAIGPGFPEGIIGLDKPLPDSLIAMAQHKNKNVREMGVCILDRARHRHFIDAVREIGARVFLIPDGDIYGIMAAGLASSPIDLYVGTGGAPEGVLAAAALACIGGQMQARLVFRNEEEISRARRLNIDRLDALYGRAELARGDILFAATGVTRGALLGPVSQTEKAARTQSMLMCARTRSVRRIDTDHEEVSLSHA